MSGLAFPKPSRTARIKKRRAGRQALEASERMSKTAAKKRDHYRCRFPLCGCRALGLVLQARVESAHGVQHKGMGGNPAGDRSVSSKLVTLCKHRHQDGVLSLHKGTLRARFQTSAQFNGPIVWEASGEVLNRLKVATRISREWFELAREVRVQEWMPSTPLQRWLLEALAAMEI